MNNIERAIDSILNGETVQLTRAEEIGVYAMAYNNTLAWEADGKVFVDTAKCPKAMLAMIAKKFKVNGNILHETHDEMVLCGEEATGLVFGGKSTICNVIEICL